MSIEDLTVKEDGAPWGASGRGAFEQIATLGLAAQEAPTAGTARIDWPGPVLWVCTYAPHSRPTAMADGDVAIDYGPLA